jgi:DNA-binding GntR family transcriptional regulator
VKAAVPAADLFADPPDLSTASGLPAHSRIEQWLTHLIGRGELVPGDRLPAEDQLAARLGVSRMTLRQALSSLEAHGTVVRKPGRFGGTFVCEPRIECDLTGLAGFTEQMRRAHVRAGARVVSAVTRPADRAAARALSLERDGQVHEIIRVRTANRQPLALERACFPAAVFPGLPQRRLTGSIYRLLDRSYGQAPHTAAETLEPVIAQAEEAGLLRVPPGTALMLIERTAYTKAGLPVEFARDLFRPDRVRISLRTGITPAARS